MHNFSISDKEQDRHFGRYDHKHNHIVFNKIHAKNINLENQEKQQFRQSVSNKCHKQNLALLKDEMSSKLRENTLKTLKKIEKWTNFKTQRKQTINAYLLIKRK